MAKRSAARKWAGFRPADLGVRAPRDEIRYDTGSTRVGPVLVAMGEAGVVAILIGDTTEELVDDLQERFPSAAVAPESLDGGEIVAHVTRYVDSPRGVLDLDLDLRGTEFQRKVWNAVRAIPAGETSDYSEIARRIGMPRAARAVGGACAANNAAFAVPCHRVLHKDGSMSWGKGWGKERQRRLLELEATAHAEFLAEKGRRPSDLRREGRPSARRRPFRPSIESR